MRTAAITAAALLLISSTVEAARIHRDQRVLREFQLLHPCPSTGRTTGACPGWQKDHVWALECGGYDELWNLQWLTVEDHKRKTKMDNLACGRALKGAPRGGKRATP